MKKKSIRILMPYFGAWPPYFSTYLQSCANNLDFDFLFVTDSPPPHDRPINVRFVPTTLRDLSQLISQKLGISIAVHWPYKLCDFRPAFGVIFSDYLAGYEYWGHGDIDVVYGKISQFISQKALADFDIISGRKEYIWGPFTIYRNTPLVNHLFYEAPDLQEILSASEFRGFDETGTQWPLYLQHQDPTVLPDLNTSMTVIVRNAVKQLKLRARFKTVVKEWLPHDDIVVVESGRVRDYRRDYLLYHFRNKKAAKGFVMPAWDKVPPRYIIRSNGFFEYDAISAQVP